MQDLSQPDSPTAVAQLLPSLWLQRLIPPLRLGLESANREGGEGSQRKECVTVGAAKQIKSSNAKCQPACEWETNTVTPRHDLPSPLLLQPRRPVITLSVIQVQIKVEAAADFRSLEHLWFIFKFFFFFCFVLGFFFLSSLFFFLFCFFQVS